MTVTHKTKCGEYESSLARQHGSITMDSFGSTTADAATRELLDARRREKENKRIALIGNGVVKRLFETIETQSSIRNKWKVICNGYLHPNEFKEVIRQFEAAKSQINLPDKESRSFKIYRKSDDGRTVLIIIDKKQKKVKSSATPN